MKELAVKTFSTCSVCKPATTDFFGAYKKSKDGLRSDCKEYRKAESAAYYEKNKEKIKVYYSQNRDKVNESQARYHEKRMKDQVKRAAYFARLFNRGNSEFGGAGEYQRTHQIHY